MGLWYWKDTRTIPFEKEAKTNTHNIRFKSNSSTPYRRGLPTPFPIKWRWRWWKINLSKKRHHSPSGAAAARRKGEKASRGPFLKWNHQDGVLCKQCLRCTNEAPRREQTNVRVCVSVCNERKGGSRTQKGKMILRKMDRAWCSCCCCFYCCLVSGCNWMIKGYCCIIKMLHSSYSGSL